MHLDDSIFLRFKSVPWFSRCGQDIAGLITFPIMPVTSLAQGIAMARCPEWADVLTHAQGDLTGYLAQQDYELYGATWNQLANAGRKRLDAEVMPIVNEGLSALGATELSGMVALDLARIALHAAYQRRFSHLPHFFSNLFVVYECGHLPCGWSGDLDSWPDGHLHVF